MKVLLTATMLGFALSALASEDYLVLKQRTRAYQNELFSIEEAIRAIKKDLNDERKNSIERYYDRALDPLKKEEAQERESAIRSLELFLKEHPQSRQRATVMLTLADLYFDVDLGKTVAVLTSFTREFPDNPHLDAAYYLQGLCYFFESESEKAKNSFQYFVKHFDHSAYLDEVRFRLGEIYFDERQYATALAYFKEIVANKSSSFYSKALYKMSWISYLENNYSEAIKLYTVLLNSEMGTSEILNREASRYIAISFADGYPNPVQAAEGYFATLTRKPWEAEVWVHMGNVLAKAEKNALAAKALQKAVDLRPGSADNQQLELRILDLSPSDEVKSRLIAQYIENPVDSAIVKPILLDWALETHNAAKKAKNPALYETAAKYYAQFIRHFQDDDTLDQTIFYYAEACFDAERFEYAVHGFEQVRDWPWGTQFRPKAALNTVYAYAQEVAKAMPEYNLTEINAEKKGQFKGKMPVVLASYIQAVDVLSARFPETPELQSFLLQAAGAELAYGEMDKAKSRLELIVERYPKQEVARSAANILLSDSLASENWLQAADDASRFKHLGPEFAGLERDSRFKYANNQFAQAKTPAEFHEVAELYLGILKNHPNSDIGDKILFNAGMSLERAQRYTEAEHLFDLMAKAHPNSPLVQEATAQRANYFEQRLLFDKAASLYLSMAKNPNAVLSAALDLEAGQKPAQAALLFERFIRENPEAPQVTDAYARAAAAYAAAGRQSDYRRVMADFEKRYKGKLARADFYALSGAFESYKALRINSDSSKKQEHQLIEKTKKLAELQKLYEQIVKEYELSSWTLASLNRIGELYEDLFQAMVKAPCPKNVSKIDEGACDEYASLLEDQAFVLEKKAIDAYQLAIDKSQNVPGGSEWTLKSKGALYRMKPSDYLPAEALLQEPIIGLNYTYSDSEESNAEYQLLVGKIKEAEALAMSSLGLNPFNMQARLQMARIFYAKHNFAAAELVLEDSIQHDATSAMSHLWLGHVYGAKGEISKAIASFEKAAELQPDLAEAFDNLGLAYLEQGDLQNAQKNLVKAGQLLPGYAPVELHLANYYVMAKEPENAQKAYDAALKLDPKLWAVKLNEGLLALSQKNFLKAEQDFKTYLAQAKPDAALRSRVESYLKLASQKVQLEKQRHE